MKEAIEGGPSVHEIAIEGDFAINPLKVLDRIETMWQLRPIYQVHGHSVTLMYSGTDLMLSVTINQLSNSGNINLVTTDQNKIKILNKLGEAFFAPENPLDGFIYALAKAPMGGYTLVKVGSAGEPIERGNYSEEVITDYDHIVADLKTANPCGRLIILAGPPGSGKTFLVRSLLQEIPRAAFVLVPAHLVQDLGSPELLPALVQVRRDGLSGAIVLVIEDADKVLVERKSGDMNAISALLNLGDGILGSSLDVRILATTNASGLEMDAATRRPGRLCRYIEVGSLSADQASKVIQRVTRKSFTFKEDATLAEIYRKARDLGWVPPPKKSSDPVTKGLAVL
jgi:ATP-dependent 26S proteasome regulatory subunit